MDDTVSRKAVFVLVILALVISVISTSLVLNAVYSVGTSSTTQTFEEVSTPPTAVAQFRVIPEPPQPPVVTGRVTFSVS